MKPILLFLIGVIIVALILILLILLSTNSGIYMFVFEHKEWQYWRLFSRNVKNFKYIGRHIGDGKSHVFAWEDYIAIVWADDYQLYGKKIGGYASVHSNGKDGDCLCTMLWKSKSLRFAKKLMKSIENKEV